MCQQVRTPEQPMKARPLSPQTRMRDALMHRKASPACYNLNQRGKSPDVTKRIDGQWNGIRTLAMDEIKSRKYARHYVPDNSFLNGMACTIKILLLQAQSARVIRCHEIARAKSMNGCNTRMQTALPWFTSRSLTVDEKCGIVLSENPVQGNDSRVQNTLPLVKGVFHDLSTRKQKQ